MHTPPPLDELEADDELELLLDTAAELLEELLAAPPGQAHTEYAVPAALQVCDACGQPAMKQDFGSFGVQVILQVQADQAIPSALQVLYPPAAQLAEGQSSCTLGAQIITAPLDELAEEALELLDEAAELAAVDEAALDELLLDAAEDELLLEAAFVVEPSPLQAQMSHCKPSSLQV